MSSILIIFCIVVGLCIITRWLKLRKIKLATRNLITSLGGIETIFAPLVTEIERVFACDNVSHSWNRVIVCDAPKGASILKSNITFRLLRTFSSYVITYSSDGKSLPRYMQTWTFSAQTSFDQIWDSICKNIGINPEINTHAIKNNEDSFRSKENSNSGLPNMSNRTVKFNFLYSFKILPQNIEEYADDKREYVDVMSPSNIPDEFEELFYRIRISTSTLCSNQEIEINSLIMPSNGGIGEVHTLLFIRNKRTRFSKLYSLEFSLDGDFCICGISTKEHGNYGFYDKSQFIDFCVSNFLKAQGISSVHIVSVTPLLEFAKRFKKMKVTGELTNSYTGENSDHVHSSMIMGL